MNEEQSIYDSESSSPTISFNPKRNKLLLKTHCKFTEDISTPTLKPHQIGSLQLSSQERRKLPSSSISRSNFSPSQQSESRGEQKSIENSASESSSAESPGKKEQERPGTISFNRRFYRRCEEFLDSLGLQTTDPNELFESLDELKRLFLCKNKSGAGNPRPQEGFSLKFSKSETVGPVINKCLVESSLLQRRSSTVKRPEPISFAKPSMKRSQFYIPRDSSFGENEHDVKSIEEIDELRVGSKPWNNDACGVLSSENSPSPLEFKTKKKREAILVLPTNDDDASPFMRSIQLLRKANY